MDCPTHFIVLFKQSRQITLLFWVQSYICEGKIGPFQNFNSTKNIFLIIFQILYKNLSLYPRSDFWRFSEQCKKLQQDNKKKLFLKTSSLSSCGVWCIFSCVQKNSQNLEFPPQCKHSCPSLLPTIVYYPSQVTL